MKFGTNCIAFLDLFYITYVKIGFGDMIPLKLSKHSPVPAAHFLLGELPIEARLHIDLLTLFHNAAGNSNSKLVQVMKYILKMAGDTSTTWSIHVRLLCRIYGLPDPLILLQSTPLTKDEWKTLVKTHSLPLSR